MLRTVFKLTLPLLVNLDSKEVLVGVRTLLSIVFGADADAAHPLWDTVEKGSAALAKFAPTLMARPWTTKPSCDPL